MVSCLVTACGRASRNPSSSLNGSRRGTPPKSTQSPQCAESASRLTIADGFWVGVAGSEWRQLTHRSNTFLPWRSS